jgi:hypothetical protein
MGLCPRNRNMEPRQPKVTKRMMEAWYWLERQGLLIHNDQQVGDWFPIEKNP